MMQFEILDTFHYFFLKKISFLPMCPYGTQMYFIVLEIGLLET